MKRLKIYTDGGSRGNPGPSGIGVAVKNEKGETVFQKGEFIGQATNNQAEYQALIYALDWLEKNSKRIEKVDFFLDSKLVVCQMKGEFKIKSPAIRPLWIKAKQIESRLDIQIDYHSIPRELNAEADGLLNQALDLTTR